MLLLGGTIGILFGGSAPAKAQGQEMPLANLNACLATCKNNGIICQKEAAKTRGKGDDKQCEDNQDKCERVCERLFR